MPCADGFRLAITAGPGHTEQQEPVWPTRGWPWASGRFLAAGDGGGGLARAISPALLPLPSAGPYPWGATLSVKARLLS